MLIPQFYTNLTQISNNNEQDNKLFLTQVFSHLIIIYFNFFWLFYLKLY